MFEDFDELVIRLDEPHKVLVDWFKFTNNIVRGNQMKSFNLLKDYFETWCRLHIYYPNSLKQLCAEWLFEAYDEAKTKASEEWLRSKEFDGGKIYDEYKSDFLSFASRFIFNETAYFDEHEEFTAPLNESYFKTIKTFANPFACYSNRYFKEKNALLRNDNQYKVIEVLENWQQYELGKPTLDNISKATKLSRSTVKRHLKNNDVREAKNRAYEVYKLVKQKAPEKPSNEPIEAIEEVSFYEAENLGFNDFDEHY